MKEIQNFQAQLNGNKFVILLSVAAKQTKKKRNIQRCFNIDAFIHMHFLSPTLKDDSNFTVLFRLFNNCGYNNTEIHITVNH